MATVRRNRRSKRGFSGDAISAEAGDEFDHLAVESIEFMSHLICARPPIHSMKGSMPAGCRRAGCRSGRGCHRDRQLVSELKGYLHKSVLGVSGMRNRGAIYSNHDVNSSPVDRGRGPDHSHN